MRSKQGVKIDISNESELRLALYQISQMSGLTNQEYCLTSCSVNIPEFFLQATETDINATGEISKYFESCDILYTCVVGDILCGSNN